MSVEANTIMQSLKSPMDTLVSPTDTTFSGICTDSTSIYYSLDSNVVYFGLDSVDSWLQNIGGDCTWYARVGLYNGLQQYTIADSLADSLIYYLNQNNLQVVNQLNNQDNSFSDLWKVVSAQEESSTYGNFILDQVLLPSSIIPPAAQNSTGPITDDLASQMINNINIIIGHGTPFIQVCFFGDPKLRKSHKSPVQPPFTNINDKSYAQLNVAPNPATNTVTFSWSTSGTAGSINIVISNTFGQAVATLSSAGSNGKTTWDTGQQPAGVYIYQASDQNGVIAQGKLVIIR